MLRGVVAALALLLSAGLACAEKRVALVIGNSAYSEVPRLANPANDATAVAEAFRRLAFDEVVLRTDLDYSGLRRTMADFTRMARGADIAIVYYAGHGIEIGGRNYLIPVDARLDDAQVADFEAMPLDLAMATLEGAKQLRVMILDACRDNPFGKRMTGGTRSVGRGLARVDAPSNTLVAYAAKEGTTADDGDGRHSPFTEALLEEIERPGVEVRLMFGKVRDAVLKRTDNRQEPFVYGAVGGKEIYLKAAPLAPVVAAVPPVLTAPVPASSSPEMEALFWNSVKDSGKEAVLRTYLDRYPQGTFSGLAKVMIEQLKAEAGTRSAAGAVAAVAPTAVNEPAAPQSPAQMVALGRRYEAGDGVARDPGKAAGWYRQAARAGNAEGKYRLGLLYYRGDGVEQSLGEAAVQILDAVGANYAPAVTALTTASELNHPDFLRTVQRRLFSLGYYSSSVDGKWGPASRAAVSAYAFGTPSTAHRPQGAELPARAAGSKRGSQKVGRTVENAPVQQKQVPVECAMINSNYMALSPQCQ